MVSIGQYGEAVFLDPLARSRWSLEPTGITELNLSFCFRLRGPEAKNNRPSGTNVIISTPYQISLKVRTS